MAQTIKIKRSTSTSAPGSLVAGELAYSDASDNQIKVYRETSSGVFEFVPIIVGDASGDSDTLDAGASPTKPRSFKWLRQSK
jgi:hypothetical protein